MLIMIYINEQMNSILKQLGERLRQARLARNESQELFASRIGITRQSYSKMEKGNGSVPIATWLAASNILGLLNTWDEVDKKLSAASRKIKS